MRYGRLAFHMCFLGVMVLLAVGAQGRKSSSKATQPSQPESDALVQTVNRIIAQENHFLRTFPTYTPRVETYLQEFSPGPNPGSVPIDDYYYLGRLAFDKETWSSSFLPEPDTSGLISHIFGDLVKPVSSKFSYDISSFALANSPDSRGLDWEHYNFQFVHSEFLGEVRCLVFDLVPRLRGDRGPFSGRIWVEDQDYHIVRFNGVHVNPPKHHYYFHFESWRQNLQLGVWLPVYTYSEESDLGPVLHSRAKAVGYKAQTRFWGYNLSYPSRDDELTRILVEAPGPVRDSSETGQSLSPLASQRAWQSEAERNVLERLEKAGLLAPQGEVDKVLETVVNNLVVTNHLDNLPPVHCRVLLTLPFESFTVGNTIVLSRGLIDVLPDEATLAMMLAHELAHIVLGHTLDTKYAFYDRLSISDEELFGTMGFKHATDQEAAADAKGLELLKSSPYKNNLANAGLFLRAMAAVAPHTPRLFGAHLGDRVGKGGEVLRMAELISGAPELQPQRVDQIAALPLGSRVTGDAWSGQVSLMKAKPVAPTTAAEKMPFQITPLIPYLSRKQMNPVQATIDKKISPASSPDN